jgi:hypothetical protein
MAITFVDYTATASQTDFSFNFDYLEDEHVTVTIDGVAKTLGELNDYTVVVESNGDTKVRLNVAATGGELVRVQRISQPGDDLVDFQNGSVLTESELDRAYLHNRYLAEESAEQNDVSLRVKTGASGSFDALNKKIVNVSDPTADQDAATKNYVDDTVASVVAGTIPDGAITAAKLDTDSVTTAKIEDSAVTSAKIEDNAVTAAKISDTDAQFLVDDTSTQKKVVVNNDLADVDFIVKSSGNGQLIVTDGANNAVGVGTAAITGFALTASNSAVGTSLVVYDASSSTEGGQILLNKATVNTPSNTETDSYVFDTFKDVDNTYEHGINADILRIVTPGTERNATTFADNGNISVTGNVFPTGDGVYDLGTSALKWGTIYASGLNINGNTSFPAKYASSWFNNTTGLANGGTYTFTHNLGTTDIQVQVYMATSSAGAGLKSVEIFREAGDYGGLISNITSTQVEIQLGFSGWAYLNSSGAITTGNWGTTYTHIKVVAIG